MSPSSPSHCSKSAPLPARMSLSASPSGQPSAWCAEARKYRNTIDIASPAFENAHTCDFGRARVVFVAADQESHDECSRNSSNRTRSPENRAHRDATPPPPDTR